VRRKLVGFEVLDRAIARHGYDVFVDGAKAGSVTSGTQTPFLKKAIGMAYVPVERSAQGSEIEIDVRGRRARARVVPLPFYKRTA
jgi:aminomethyltransferase